MALVARSMYKLILRVHVRREIDPYAYKYLLDHQPWSVNWDGEIFLFRAMNQWDMEKFSEDLMSFGYKWSKDLNDADFAWSDLEVPSLDWLEEIPATPLKKKLEPVHLWQMKNSRIDWFHDGVDIQYRGTDYDW